MNKTTILILGLVAGGLLGHFGGKMISSSRNTAIEPTKPTPTVKGIGGEFLNYSKVKKEIQAFAKFSEKNGIHSIGGSVPVDSMKKLLTMLPKGSANLKYAFTLYQKGSISELIPIFFAEPSKFPDVEGKVLLPTCICPKCCEPPNPADSIKRIGF